MYYSNQTLNHGASASVIVGVETRNVTMRCIFAGRYVTVLSFIHARPCRAAKLQSSRVMGIAEIRGEKTRHGLYVSACISVRYDKAIFNVRLKTDLFNS